MDDYSIDDDFLYKHTESAENIILDNLPKEEDLSHRFSKRFKRKMQRLIKEERRSPYLNRFVNYSRRAAMIILIVVSILFATTMSIEAYRERFFDKVIEILEEYTSIRFEVDEDVVGEDLVPIFPEYIPEGFSIYDGEITRSRNNIVYKNQEGIEITYEQIIGRGQAVLDTEGIEVEYIDIGNCKGVIFSNKESTQLQLSDELYLYRFISDVEKDEIIKMAESIIENK